MALSLAFAAPARAATFDVPCPGAAELKGAITTANSSAGADTVRLAPGCVYGFTSTDNWWYGPNALPPIASNVTIDGRGATIQRPPITADDMRLFFVGADPNDADTQDYTSPGTGTLTLRNLTLAGGLAKGGDSGLGGGGAGLGGAIFSQGDVSLEGVTVRDSTAQGGNSDGDSGLGGSGGGLGEDALTGVGGGGFGGPITGVAKSSGGAGATNPGGVAHGGGGGGFRPQDDGVAGGSATAPGGGGGPRTGLGGNAGPTSGLSGNGSGAGGAHNGIIATGRGGDFGGGGTYPNGGGGVGGGGAAGDDVLDQFFSGGGGFGGGGGSAGEDSAGDGGFGGGGGYSTNLGGGGSPGTGGFGAGNGGSDLGSSGGGGAGMGGAIFSMQGELSIINSTFAGNRAIGGVGDGGGGEGTGIGGAIFNLNGSAFIESSTLATNVARHGDDTPAQGGALYNLVYDAATARQAKVTIQHSILAGNAGSASDVNSNRPALVADGSTANKGAADVEVHARNLITVTQTAGGGTITGTPISADPQLGPLQDNGGPTKTMKPASTSPVVDAGDADILFCPLTDQRGVGRFQDEACDIGAVELDTSAPDVQINSAPSNPDNSTAATFTFSAFEPNVTFYCRLDQQGAFAPCGTPKSYSGLSEGQHVFEVAAVDIDGNNSGAVTHTWNVDLTPPETNLLEGPTGRTTDRTPRFTFEGQGKRGDIGFQCKLDRKPYRACVSPKTLRRLDFGRHRFRVRALDEAGNVDGTPSVARFRVIRR